MIGGAIRVVLDTDVLVSALLFEKGRLARLRHSWQTTAIKPVLAEPTARELVRVLAYPKFRLSPPDIERLLEDVLPWCESWQHDILPCGYKVRDHQDQVFLDLALTAGVSALVSGDADLLDLRPELASLLILPPADVLTWLAKLQGTGLDVG